MNALYKQLLTASEAAIAELNIPPSPQNLYEPIRYTMSLGGKRVRPVLVLLGAKLYGVDPMLALPQAVAVEVFHNFTLVHDDVMDSADVRRKLPTVHKKWNHNIALLSGDAMLVMAYQQLFQANPVQHARLQEVFSTTAMQVCEGQQLDMDYATDVHVSIEEYSAMIRLKTAVLLSGALKIGSIVANAPSEDFALIDEFAESVGMAFQLKDDLLDTFGGNSFGKEIGGDIREGKRTWLVLKAMELASADQRAQLSEAMQLNDLSARVVQVTSIFQSLKIDDLAAAEVQRYSNKAIEALDLLKGDAEAKECLRWLVHQLIDRTT